jgi:hypothetical protein
MKMADVYIALRCQVLGELDIVVIWCVKFLGWHKPHLKIGEYVDSKNVL